MSKFNEVAKFRKVSINQYVLASEYARTDFIALRNEHKDFKLPERSTKGSAGYDFFAPFDFTLKAGESIKIPTGVRCEISDGWVLMMYPRSSMGKYHIRLANTTGVIDSDYFNADNEGHIHIMLDNTGSKDWVVHAGDRIAQGVFLQFGITVNDEANASRTGGMGSTGK